MFKLFLLKFPMHYDIIITLRQGERLLKFVLHSLKCLFLSHAADFERFFGKIQL